MKKLFVVFTLLGFVSAVLLTGCSQEPAETTPPPPPDTNAPAE